MSDPKKPEDLADKKDAAMEQEASKADASKVADKAGGTATEVSPSDAMAKQPGFDDLKK